MNSETKLVLLDTVGEVQSLKDDLQLVDIVEDFSKAHSFDDMGLTLIRYKPIIKVSMICACSQDME